jgi:hypothetical protein
MGKPVVLYDPGRRTANLMLAHSVSSIAIELHELIRYVFFHACRLKGEEAGG